MASGTSAAALSVHVNTLRYRLARVDMINDMKTAAYARLNGRQETPVLIRPDGKPLTESMAIALWLEARDTDRRISFDPKSAEADRMHQLMGFLNTGFTGAFSPLWSALEMETPNPVLQDNLNGEEIEIGLALLELPPENGKPAGLILQPQPAP